MPDDDPDIPDLVDGVPIDEGGDATNGEAADVPAEADEAEADTDGTDDTADGSSGGTAGFSSDVRAPGGEEAPTFDVSDEVRVPARFKEIHEARRQAAEVFRNLSEKRIEALQAAKRLSPRGAERWAQNMVQAHLRDTVQAYIVEVEPLMSRVDAGEWYWRNAPLGTIEFDDLAARVDDASAPDPVPIEGLRDYVTADGEFSRSISHKQHPEGTAYGTRTVTESTTVVMPVEISREAFRATNSFLADIGLDLAPDEAEQVKSFTWE